MDLEIPALSEDSVKTEQHQKQTNMLVDFPQFQTVLGSKFTRPDAFNDSNWPFSRFPWAGDTVQGLRHLLFFAEDLPLVPRTHN